MKYRSISILVFIVFITIDQTIAQLNNFDRAYNLGYYTKGKYVKAVSGNRYIVFGYNMDSWPPYTDGVVNAIATLIDANGDTLKTKKVGSDSTFAFFSYATSVNDSEFIAVGAYSNGLSNPYDYDIFLAKFNLNLDTLWTKAISDPGTGTAALKVNTIIKTSDGNFVIGGYQNDWCCAWFTSFLMKINGNGNMLWYHNYTQLSHHTIWGVAEATNGDLICSGTSIPYPGANESNMLIAKTDSLGNNYQVLQNIATTDRNYGTQVQSTYDNNFIVSGEFRGCFICDAYSWGILIDGNGNIIWDKKYAQGSNGSGFAVIKSLSDGGYLGAGAVNRQNESKHGLILKMDANGDSLWSREFFTPNSFEIFWDVDTTSDGGFVMTGETYCCNYTPGQGYTSSLWVVKTDSLGFIVTGLNDLPGFSNYNMGNVYPNPVTNVLNVPVTITQANATATITGKQGVYLYVFDMQGRQMVLQQLLTGTKTATLNVGDLAVGTYVAVLVVDGYKIGSQKFVKE